MCNVYSKNIVDETHRQIQKNTHLSTQHIFVLVIKNSLSFTIFFSEILLLIKLFHQTLTYQDDLIGFSAHCNRSRILID